MAMKNDALRAKMEEEKALLIEELKEIGMIVDEKAGTWEAVPEKQLPTSDENDLADKFESYEERSDMLKTLRTRYEEIVSALAKMDSTGFGICETCGAPIEADRMAANPAAKTCKAHMND
jgi:RNA polymerase-binding transcription factor DksA